MILFIKLDIPSGTFPYVLVHLALSAGLRKSYQVPAEMTLPMRKRYSCRSYKTSLKLMNESASYG